MLSKGPILSHTTKIFHQCRNASTRHGKKGVKKNQHNNPHSPRPPNPKHNVTSTVNQPKYPDLATQTWVIEPRIPFWQAKLRTQMPPSVILATIGFALTSIYLTSTAFPDPTASPPMPAPTPTTSTSTSASTPPDTPESESQGSTLTSTLLYPITFVFRPLFVDESLIDDSKKSWRYKAGFAAGIASLLLFSVSHLRGPRYVRYLSISPRDVNANANANVNVGQSAGSGQTAVRGEGGAVMRIYPAFARRGVTHPVSRSMLVSPVSTNDQEKVLSTVRIVGAPRSLRSVGWGVSMFKDGALVNGKVMPQEEVVSLMERIWVAHGGKISVA